METGKGPRNSYFRCSSVYSTDYNCTAEGEDLTQFAQSWIIMLDTRVVNWKSFWKFNLNILKDFLPVQTFQITVHLPTCLLAVFGRPYYRSCLWHSVSSVCLWHFVFWRNGWTDLHEIFREGVEWPWDDLITFWVHSGKPRDATMLISLSATLLQNGWTDLHECITAFA